MARMGAQQANEGANAELDEKEGVQARLNRQVEEARRRVSEQVAGARERIGDLQSQAYDAWDDAVDYIRENPGKIIAFSLGVGLAIGALLRFGRGRNTWMEEE